MRNTICPECKQNKRGPIDWINNPTNDEIIEGKIFNITIAGLGICESIERTIKSIDVDLLELNLKHLNELRAKRHELIKKIEDPYTKLELMEKEYSNASEKLIDKLNRVLEKLNNRDKE